MPEKTEITISADISEFERAQKAIEKELSITKKMLEELNRITKEGGLTWREQAREAIKGLKEEYTLLKDTSDMLRAMIKRAEEMGKTGETATKKMTIEMEKLKRTLSEVEETMQKIESAVEETRKTSERASTGITGYVAGMTRAMTVAGMGMATVAVYQGISMAVREEEALRTIRRVAGPGAVPTGRWEAIARMAGIPRAEALGMLAGIAPMLGGGVGPETAQRMMILLGARGVAPEQWGAFFQRLIGLGGAVFAGPTEAADRRRAEVIGEVFSTAFMLKVDRRLPMFMQAISKAVEGPLSEFIARQEDVHGAVMGMLRMTAGLARLLPGYAPEQVARVAGAIGQMLVSPRVPFAEAMTYRMISEAIRGGAFAGMPFFTGRGTFPEVMMARFMLPEMLGRQTPEAMRVIGGVFAPLLGMVRQMGDIGGQMAAMVLTQMLPGVDIRTAATLLENLARATAGRVISPEEIGRMIMGELKKLPRPPRTIEEILTDIEKSTGDFFTKMADAMDTLTIVGKAALPVYTLLRTVIPGAFALIMKLLPKEAIEYAIPAEAWADPLIARILREKGFMPPPVRLEREVFTPEELAAAFERGRIPGVQLRMPEQRARELQRGLEKLISSYYKEEVDPRTGRVRMRLTPLGEAAFAGGYVREVAPGIRVKVVRPELEAMRINIHIPEFGKTLELLIPVGQRK